MPRRKSRREKIEAGTLRENRADRPIVVLTVAQAQAKAQTATIALTQARQKAQQKKPKLTVRQKRLALSAIPTREVALECALEDLATAMKFAEQQAATPDIRPGLADIPATYSNFLEFNPPLSEDEEMVWMFGPPAK
jgi:hypothetical protein